MNVNEKECKTILSESNLYGIEYSINPYTGCEHGCRYCYATYMKKFSDHPEPWGKFVDVKKNVKKVLEKDLKKKEKGKILLSSVTDPYQPVEKEYEKTRKILKTLSEKDWETNILTKSDLILRDMDILTNFEKNQIHVGLTINFLKERDKNIWEPNAPNIQKRIQALERISKKPIQTYVHTGPYFEGITNLKKIVEKIEDFADELQIEPINLKNDKKILNTVKRHYPELEEKYKQIKDDPLPHQIDLKDEVDEIRKNTDLKIKLFLE